MSRSPNFFVERFNKYTNKYELQHPIIWNWDHTKQITADLYPYNGDHDLFSIVEENGNNFPSMNGIHIGLPENVSEDIRKRFDEYSYDIKARWFTYADMYIYCLEHPEVKDYDAIEEAYYYAQEGEKVDENIMMPNPLRGLKDRVDAFFEVMDDGSWKDDYSQIRIVYWID